jgi:CheY-like chemotaxis protein
MEGSETMTEAQVARIATARVLLIEDNADIRETIAVILELEGYEVHATANGDEALGSLSDGFRPDLILLDLMMPVMDGWEFRKRQLLASDLAGIPTVVMSGDASVSKKASSLGCRHSLGKPIAIDALLSTVKAVL